MRRLAIVAALAGFVLAICAFGAQELERALANATGRQPQLAYPAQAPPQAGPALQVNGPSELDAYRREKEAELHTYRWVDRAHGVAAVPIDLAMSMVAAAASGKDRR